MSEDNAKQKATALYEAAEKANGWDTTEDEAMKHEVIHWIMKNRSVPTSSGTTWRAFADIAASLAHFIKN